MWLKVILFCIFGCTSSLTTSFDLGGVVTGNRMAAVPLGRSLGDGELDVEGICTKAGMVCQDCKKSVTCVALPVGWLKVPLEECRDGLTCNAKEGRCSNNTVPECDIKTQKYQHICEQVGIFPDAYNCRKFHLCSPPEGLPDGRPADHRSALCPRNYGYNPQTAQCSIKLPYGQCLEKPVPPCTKIGHTEVLASSPNHYYVCLLKHGALYPQIFICPHGWYFWDGFCRPEPKIITKKDSNETKPTKEKDNTISTDSSTTNEKDSEDTSHKKNRDNVIRTESSTNKNIKASTTRMESFFSTERATTYAADSFLADKFDLANYESTDDKAPSMDDFTNSFENFDDFQ